jgi:hypothetical protein
MIEVVWAEKDHGRADKADEERRLSRTERGPEAGPTASNGFHDASGLPMAPSADLIIAEHMI